MQELGDVSSLDFFVHCFFSSLQQDRSEFLLFKKKNGGFFFQSAKKCADAFGADVGEFPLIRPEKCEVLKDFLHPKNPEPSYGNTRPS